MDHYIKHSVIDKRGSGVAGCIERDIFVTLHISAGRGYDGDRVGFLLYRNMVRNLVDELITHRSRRKSLVHTLSAASKCAPSSTVVKFVPPSE